MTNTTTQPWFRYYLQPGVGYFVGYDQDGHRWDPDHVHPGFVAFCQVDPQIATPPPPPPNSPATPSGSPATAPNALLAPFPTKASRSDGGGRARRFFSRNTPSLNGRLGGLSSDGLDNRIADHPLADPPNQDVSGITYRVESLDMAFPTLEYNARNRRSNQFWQVPLLIPGPTNIKISVDVWFKNGAVERASGKRLVNDWLIASIGDSYASGQGRPDVPTRWDDWTGFDHNACELTTIAAGFEGLVGAAPGFVDEPAVWQEPEAWRAAYNSHYQAVERVQQSGSAYPITFVTVASSGATVPKGLLGKQRSFQTEGQIDELKRALKVPGRRAYRRPDVLIVSIGGNDVGFVDTLKTVMLPGTANLGVTLADHSIFEALKPVPGVSVTASARKSALRKKFDADLAALDDWFQGVSVVVGEQ